MFLKGIRKRERSFEIMDVYIGDLNKGFGMMGKID